MNIKHISVVLTVIISLLGCSGVSEELLKSTGVDYTVTEDGDVSIDVDVGDFSMKSQSGPNAQVPEDYPIAYPDGLTIESVSEIQVEGQLVTSVSFRLGDQTDEEIINFYQSQYEESAVQHNINMGVKTTVLTLSGNEDKQAVDSGRSVTITDFAGQRTLSLNHTMPVSQ